MLLSLQENLHQISWLLCDDVVGRGDKRASTGSVNAVKGKLNKLDIN